MNGARPEPHGHRYAARVGFSQTTVAQLQDSVNARLSALAPDEGAVAAELAQSIRYSLLAPGKRARAIMVLLVAADLDADMDAALVPACAVELLHTASLIIDDLPAMDDASLRRGRASNHVRYGEDTAILAAITMMSDAFALVAGCQALNPGCRNDIVTRLAGGVGMQGLAAGQHLDLRAGRRVGSARDVERIYSLKTGALFAASAWMGGRVAALDEATLGALSDFGMHVGLAFQGYDDLADRLGSLETAGKNVRADARKATMVALQGTSEAEAVADAAFADAIEGLRGIGMGSGRLAVFVAELRDKLKSRIVVRPAEPPGADAAAS